MKQQKINKPKSKSPIIYDRINKDDDHSEAAPAKSDVPVRAVIYVDVKDMSQRQVGQLLAQINLSYQNAKGGIHYIIPIRNGKLSTDIYFENEILDLVNKICEVNDGQIVLKNGFTEVTINREIV